jgi:uncharacterized membrane protein
VVKEFLQNVDMGSMALLLWLWSPQVIILENIVAYDTRFGGVVLNYSFFAFHCKKEAVQQ